MPVPVLLAAAWLLTGCSLLKVSVASNEPLPAEQMRTRVLTRGFYHDFSDAVVRTADTIAGRTPEPVWRMRTIRWKLQATRAAVSAAMQSIPDVALADTWILCRRMDESFAHTADSALFGPQSELAREMARRYASKVDSLAGSLLSSDHYDLMRRFVDEYMRNNPAGGADLAAANTTLAWLEYLKANDVEYLYSSGSISEVIADMGDKVEGQTGQFAHALGWSRDMVALQLEQDSVRSRIEGQLDSLDRNFRRMVVVMEHVPEISDAVVTSFGNQVQSLIAALDVSVDNVFSNIDMQRAELQHYVSSERETLVREARAAADEAIRTALDGLPALVGKMVGWIILLGVVVLGLPFVLGFWLGALRERRTRRRSDEIR